MTDAERARRYRDRKRGAPPRQLAPCGTVTAYKRHQRHKESPCASCRAAWADWQRFYYVLHKADTSPSARARRALRTLPERGGNELT